MGAAFATLLEIGMKLEREQVQGARAYERSDNESRRGYANGYKLKTIDTRAVHWRAFLESLIERGMHGVRMIVSDDHAGIRAARKCALPGRALATMPVPSRAERDGLRPTHEHAS